MISEMGGWEKVFHWLHYDRESAYAEFTSSWPKIKYRLHEGPLEQALAKAKVCPVKAPKRDGLPPAPKYDLFIGLCGFLQFTRGNFAPGHSEQPEPFYLSCRKIGELLETTPRMVSIWRQWAIAAGFLVPISKHEFRSTGRSKASEFIVADAYRDQFAAFYTKKIG